MAVWYDLIKHLRDYLRSQTPRLAKYIEAGALDPDSLDLTPGDDGIGGAILIIRDREPDEKLFKGGEGTVIFFAENWIRCDDPDPLVGYQLLSDQEDRFKTALTAWALQTGPETVGADVLNVEIEETIGDADSRRPTLGSRTTIRVTWSKRTM